MKQSKYQQSMESIRMDEQAKRRIHDAIIQADKVNQVDKRRKKAYIMNKYTKIGMGAVAALAITVGAFSLQPKDGDLSQEQNLASETSVGAENPGDGEVMVSASRFVNIDGIITHVETEDEATIITLDNGMSVRVTADTVLGIDGPMAPPKEEQLMDDDFVVGNVVSGYTLDNVEESEVVTANQLYNNFAPEAN